ncbi:MAG: hypothetical protein WDK96_03530, partial [Candidatus Paceibacterota bacterium]
MANIVKIKIETPDVFTTEKENELKIALADTYKRIIGKDYFLDFLSNIEIEKIESVEPKIIKIDRTKPFDPATFIGASWTIVEQDERAIALTEIDLT